MSLSRIASDIVHCDRCPRLRSFCERIGREKRAAYRDQTYWARPVPGFGDPNARIVVVGLAPAAHGANRTGRMFTGDGTGGSADFLMAAMHANGLANHPYSRSADDGLALVGTWMLAAVRCAPPDNKPSPDEIAACHAHFRAEALALPERRVYVALGRIAFDACLRLIGETTAVPKPRPAFAHGVVVRFAAGPALIASYHPSRQNTHTGRLTPAMLRAVFKTAASISARPSTSDKTPASAPTSRTPRGARARART
jgi:uracil-DNA glycosylase family 4